MKKIVIIAFTLSLAFIVPVTALAETLTPAESELIQAAYDGSLPVVEKLVKNGASVNVANKQDRTPLIVAAFKGHASIVEYLQGKGADINAQDGGGYSALMYACKRSFNEIGEFLIEKGADINARSKKKGVTALMIAAALGNVKMVNQLLEHGADKSIKDRFGATAEVIAKKRGHVGVVEILEVQPAAETSP